MFALIEASHLDCHLVRFRPAAGERSCHELPRRKVGQTFGQIKRYVGGIDRSAGVVELGHLLADRLDDPLTAITKCRGPGMATHQVEELAARNVTDPHALAALEDYR